LEGQEWHFSPSAACTRLYHGHLSAALEAGGVVPVLQFVQKVCYRRAVFFSWKQGISHTMVFFAAGALQGQRILFSWSEGFFPQTEVEVAS